MNNNKFTLPSIIFFAVILISFFLLKWGVSISAGLAIVGFGITYYLMKVLNKK